MSALLVVLVFSQVAADAGEAFEPVDTKNGVALLARRVPGSPFKEYQAKLTTTVSAKDLCEGVFDWATLAPESPGLTEHKLLVDVADRRVIYAHISQPVVANRDYVLEVVRERLDEAHCRVRFRTTTEAAPPKPDGYVRMNKVWGEWRFDATPGGTEVAYSLFSDPAGSIPAFLVHGPQRDVTRDTIVLAVERVKQALAKRSLQQR
ncbi:MAG: hypothetical protein JNJ54_21660 [Myxococcaceae bacterium]|nr:hypothetical protein [Myxococcaceae bacterium]